MGFCLNRIIINIISRIIQSIVRQGLMQNKKKRKSFTFRNGLICTLLVFLSLSGFVMKINVHRNEQTNTFFPPDLVKSECRWACEVNSAEHCNSLFLFHQCSAQVSSKKAQFLLLHLCSPNLEYNISRYFCTAIRICPHKMMFQTSDTLLTCSLICFFFRYKC